MGFILSVIAATAPALIFVAIVYWFDRFEKEPLWLLAAVFIWGAVPGIAGAFIVNTFIGSLAYLVAGENVAEIFTSILVAPPVEETIKGAALLGIMLFFRREMDSLLDGIIYGAMVGFGFALVENVWYFMNQLAAGGLEAWLTNVVLRTLFGLNHAYFTSLTGMGLALALLHPNKLLRWSAPFIGWGAAVLAHSIHNGSATLAGVQALFCLPAFLNTYGGVLVVLVIIGWSLIRERKWITQYLRPEVALGTLTPAQYQLACSTWTRAQLQWKTLLGLEIGRFFQQERFYRQCSKLAFQRRHAERLGDEAAGQAVVNLRHKVTGQSRLM